MTRTPDYTATIQLLNQKLINLEKHRTNLQTQLAQIQSAKAFKIWQYLTLIKHGSLKLIHQPSKLPKAVSTLFSHGPTALTDKVNLAISNNLSIFVLVDFNNITPFPI